MPADLLIFIVRVPPIRSRYFSGVLAYTPHPTPLNGPELDFPLK